MTLTTPSAVVSPAGEESAWDTAVSAESASHFRPDIEGLRAVAILAVLGFHTRLPGFGGGFVGVDVFFVISGFLITGLLLREKKATGGIDFAAFYARRARRLLPAALIVIVITLVASAVVLSPVRFPEVARDGGAAALYVSNYRYAIIATDYFAADTQPSPLLHFWSLAVEEQFYLFWPLILMGLASVFSVRHMWPAVVGIVLASYALTIVVAGIEPPWAFYSLPTRAWQLALGAVVALGVLSLPAHWPRWLGSVLGLVGLALIAEAVVVVDGTTPYGISGLLPAVGAALFIIGGDRTGAIPARLLATSVPRWFGRISYSLYLWHWPILILIPIVIGHGGLPVRVALALLSIVVAAASTRFIETPFRMRRWSTASGRTLLAAAGCSVAIAFGAVATSGQFVRGTEGAPLPTLGPATAEQPPLPKPVLSGPLPDDLQPTLVDAGRDRAAPGLEECRSGLTESDPRDCVYGSDPSAPTVVMFGDSHAAMWLPGMVALADDAPWRLVALTKPGCSPVLVTLWGRQLQRPSHECDEWRDLALQRIRELHPSIVFVTSSRNYEIADAEGDAPATDKAAKWYDGLVDVLDELGGSADRVILIGETPHYRQDPVECLATHDMIEECIEPRSGMVSRRYQLLERNAAEAAGAALIEPIDWLCQEHTCAPVMDHYLVYRNPGHLTATIATVLAPQMRWAIEGLP